MSPDGAALLVASLLAAFPTAEVLPQTAGVYRLALDRHDDQEVLEHLGEIVRRHEWPQRLPTPREIEDALPPPWPLYARYAKLRARAQEGATLTDSEARDLGMIEHRIGVPRSCRLGTLPATTRPRERMIQP
jgi:hypothetical protein